MFSCFGHSGDLALSLSVYLGFNPLFCRWSASDFLFIGYTSASDSFYLVWFALWASILADPLKRKETYPSFYNIRRHYRWHLWLVCWHLVVSVLILQRTFIAYIFDGAHKSLARRRITDISMCIRNRKPIRANICYAINSGPKRNLQPKLVNTCRITSSKGPC